MKEQAQRLPETIPTSSGILVPAPVQPISLWQEQQLQALSHPATKKQLGMRKHLPPVESWQKVTHLPMLNYQPDRAVRAAIVSTHDWKKWKKDGVTYWGYRYPANPTHDLHVYLGGPRPPSQEEGTLITERFRLSMILYGRICLSIWLSRRRDERLTQTGSALISLDEILTIRGVKKSREVIHRGEHQVVSYSNGFRWEDKQAILDDLVTLQQLYLTGSCVINVGGHWEDLGIEADQYLRFTLLTKKNERGLDEKIGIFFTPGNWLNLHENKNAIYIAEVERELFKLNPQQDYHELLIGLHLAERWRDLARKQDYTKPTSMQNILEGSFITMDKKNPSRFIRRIEDALESLYTRGILGARPECLTPVDRSKTRWTGEWLASQWQLVPPQSIIEHYRQNVSLPTIIDAEAVKSSSRRREKK